MKNLIITIAIGCALFTAGYGTATLYRQSTEPKEATTAPCDALERFIDALEWKESKGVTDAIGDGGKAIGCLQIWKIMVDDVNRILKLQGSQTQYFYQARKVRSSSREMCKIYLAHYCAGMSWSNKARCWNGGPKGYKKDCTIDYGNDVVNLMK